MEDDSETEAEQLQIKAFLEMVKSNPEYRTKTIYNGQKTVVLEKDKEIIWIIDFFKGKYFLDFITKEAVDAIIELMQKEPG